jgi:hypothetical protein
VYDACKAWSSVSRTTWGCATRPHAGQGDMPRARVAIVSWCCPPAVPRAQPATSSVRACAGSAIQAPHSPYRRRRVLLGCSPHHAGVPGTRLAATASCELPPNRHGGSRNRSTVTRWASVAHHRRSIMGDLLWWSLGQTPPRLRWQVSCDPPRASTSHTARRPHAPSALCLHRRHTGEAAQGVVEQHHRWHAPMTHMTGP